MGNATDNRKIGIYSPYLDILGGGERYILTIAEYFADDLKSSTVDLFWNNNLIIKRAKERLNIDLDKVNIVSLQKNFAERTLRLSRYDAFFYVTDGSAFFYPGKNGFLIIHSPAHIPQLAGFIDKKKLNSWQNIVCYSRFVADLVEDKVNRQVEVIPPPADTNSFEVGRKKSFILSVGRFFSHLHSKKQDILVKIFKEMIDSNKLNNWRLVLAGSVQKGEDRRYLGKIKKQADGYPVDIMENISFDVLKKLYAEAKIFWLATGFGEDLKNHPERAEHFGISTVEAMASGCVPVVFNGGGQKEVVTDGINGYLFNSPEELKKKTLSVANDDDLRLRISDRARNRSLTFSKDAFINKIKQIIG